ncbi:MAG: hypothetical protein ACI4AA_09070 [Lachnospiraceae bacterium]
MPSVITYLLVALMGIMGGLTSIYLLISIPVLLVWKIYRKIKYGYSLYQ